jgi:lipopolysaccharide/colanic/teichoic acid biosynthesis glycosyltransferase
MDSDFVREPSQEIPIQTAFRLDNLVESSIWIESRRRSRAGIDRSEVSQWALSGVRRGMDVVLATVALTISLPFMGLAALAVRFSSPGPILFKQKRMGRAGNVFTLYKFRSMRLEAELSSHITVTGDSRITRTGSLLRKYKLDELPQFWNVLRGDMSLVGPRPKLPHHEGLHMLFRPGITGAATLAFRHEEQMLSQIPSEHLDAYYDQYVKPLKAKIDWEYMRSASLKSDLGILWQTAKCCFSQKPSKYRAVLPAYNRSAHEKSAHERSLHATGTEPEPIFSFPIA